MSRAALARLSGLALIWARPRRRRRARPSGRPYRGGDAEWPTDQAMARPARGSRWLRPRSGDVPSLDERGER